MSLTHPYLYRVVAGYRLTDYVGAGGMGEVFKACHIETGKLAAVKVLYRPEFADRFHNEGTVHASISHLNIAALYEVSQIDNRPALIIEWIDGLSLDELIRRKGRLSNEEATRIVQQLLNAVTYLHQMGIIHRDLKSSNVRIRPDGQVKVLDFGIAQGRSTPKFTKVGYAVGTAEFMAPEQFHGQGEQKSDVWALGVMLYEMTTGHLPFDSTNPILLRQQIERGHFTSPQILNPAISPGLVETITNCLQVNPARRPAAVDIATTRQKPVEQSALITLYSSIHSIYYWLLAGVAFLGLVFLLTSTPTDPKKAEQQTRRTVQPANQYEEIQVEVLNADYDIELVMPDGTVQHKEPFVVKRLPGQSLPITIRHQGAEQQFVIEPDVQALYQCYFDR